MSDTPLIVINPSECQIAYHHQKSPIIYFPDYLEPNGNEIFRDLSGKQRRLWKMQRLERDAITYDVRSLPDADYVVTNQHTNKRTVIRRFTVQEMINIWNRHGKYALEGIFDAIADEYMDIDVVELVIENYFSCRFQYGDDNAIYAPWREQVSHKRLDSSKHPLFSTTYWVRQDFDPRLMMELLQRVEQKGVKVCRFFDAVDTYNHFKELLFRRDDARLEKKSTLIQTKYSSEDRLYHMFPEIDFLLWRSLLRKYGTVSLLLKAIIDAKSVEELCRSDASIQIAYDIFQRLKTFLVSST